jgi:hypothetical protein
VKALSIRQPWAWAIVTGRKPVENRDWSTSFRGRVLIHAGKRIDDGAVFLPEGASEYCPRDEDLPLGGIVGVATIVDCVTAHPSPWFVGRFGFVFKDARPLPLVPCRGQLGFFDVPADVAERLRALAGAT